MKIFTAKERKNLEYVLSKAPEEGDAMYLEELHGLLFGLAIAPAETLPAEWVPMVFSEQQPRYNDQKDEDACLRHLTNAYERMVNDRQLGKLAFPFNYKKLSDDDFMAIEGWTYGLFLAISLRLDAWGLEKNNTEQDFKNLSEDTLELLDAFSTITAIAMPEAMEEAFQEIMESESIDEESLQASFYSMLPGSVAILQKNAGRIREERKLDDQSAPIGKCQKKQKAG